MSSYVLCSTGFTQSVSGQLSCSVPITTQSEISLQQLMQDYITLAFQNSNLSYDDFLLLGGAIFSMSMVAYGLKQIRLVINR